MKYFIFILVLLAAPRIFAQRINTSFGKNRVQFHKDYDEWRKYQSEHFTSYWYGRAKNIAIAALDIAEQEYGGIRQLMEYRLNDKIELLIFTDLTDVKQSNIGNDDIFLGKSGESTVIGNKIFMYFDGNHNHLIRSIREGIAEVFLNQMYIGSGLKEIIKNKLMLDVPIWYKQGLISYVGSSWDNDIDNKFENIVSDLKEKDWDFITLAKRYPKEIGHSFWSYIDQTYGRSSISNILYLTRIYKNTDEAFLYEFSQDIERTFSDWKSYYYDNYHRSKPKSNAFFKKNKYILKTKKDEIITKLAISPDSKNLLICKNHHGKYKILIHHIKTKNQKTIFKYGYKNLLQETDYNYPVFSWIDSENFSVIYEKRDVLYLRKININTQQYIEQIMPRIFQRIYSLSAINDIEYLVSGSVDGYSNLYIYNAKKRRYRALTDDKYDDLDADFISTSTHKGVFFISTRLQDLKANKIELKHFNLCYLDLKEENQDIIKFNLNPNASIRQIKYIGDKRISYLSDKTGKWQQFIWDKNLNKEILITSRNKEVSTYDSDGLNQNIVVLKHERRQYVISDNTDWSAQNEQMSYFKNKQITKKTKQLKFKDKEEIPSEYLFITEFQAPEKHIYLSDKEMDTSAIKKHEFKIENITGARLEFRLDDYSIDFSNELLFEGLETYIEDQNEAQLLDNKGFLIKANVLDLFENYDIEAGIRLPTKLNGNEVYLVAKDNKRLIDREYIIYRKSKKNTELDPVFYNIQKTKKTALLTMLRLKYPFDIYRSLRLSTSYRIDKYFYQGIDDIHYYDPVINDKRLSVKLEYIYDNTINKDLNVLHGTRYKFYAEAINKFDIQIFDNPSFELSTGHSFVIGMDARNYLPIGSNAVFASRFAAFTSFGSEKILYQIGGVENWLNPVFNDNGPTIEGQNFSYFYNVANMRGFKNNSRNGNSAAIGSLELRVAPFKYLTAKRIRNSFFRNFQVNLFFDIGTAWYGLSPFNDNPLNEVHISQPPVIELDITYHRDPIIWGYGIGVRSTILGVLIRADYGWGIESGILQDPILHMAIGKDF